MMGWRSSSLEIADISAYIGMTLLEIEFAQTK